MFAWKRRERNRFSFDLFLSSLIHRYFAHVRNIHMSVRSVDYSDDVYEEAWAELAYIDVWWPGRSRTSCFPDERHVALKRTNNLAIIVLDILTQSCTICALVVETRWSETRLQYKYCMKHIADIGSFFSLTKWGNTVDSVPGLRLEIFLIDYAMCCEFTSKDTNHVIGYFSKITFWHSLNILINLFLIMLNRSRKREKNVIPKS